MTWKNLNYYKKGMVSGGLVGFIIGIIQTIGMMSGNPLPIPLSAFIFIFGHAFIAFIFRPVGFYAADMLGIILQPFIYMLIGLLIGSAVGIIFKKSE